MEQRKYIIGRKGQIQLHDKTTSAQHAELKTIDNRLYLTDLGSTNGTFLVEDGKRTRFTEGFVELDQTLAFGNQVCSVRELVARAELEN
jgi:pSer/pThr/pTyr-binding forkhead associated (FHA) protein